MGKDTKITLIGNGFVGKAVNNLIKKHYQIKIVDPQYNDNKIENDTDSYIVCVPTPSSATGECDMSIVNKVIDECPNDKPILIKSTISLEGWEKIKEYGKRITFSPEFLTARNANEDFKKQKVILFGGDDIAYWEAIFHPTKKFKTVAASVEELILTKYLRNSFLATKVAFFNEAYSFCEKVGIDYNTVSRLVGMDDRITMSHILVPGPDGERGFGGECFPKDTKALSATGFYYGSNFDVLGGAIKSNMKVKKLIAEKRIGG